MLIRPRLNAPNSCFDKGQPEPFALILLFLTQMNRFGGMINLLPTPLFSLIHRVHILSVCVSDFIRVCVRHAAIWVSVLSPSESAQRGQTYTRTNIVHGYCFAPGLLKTFHLKLQRGSPRQRNNTRVRFF